MIKTFNCTGNGTTITPLPRPYWCCGWGIPPASFSGKYSCTTVGGPPIYSYCDATNQPFTLTLVSVCKEYGPGTYGYIYTTTGTLPPTNYPRSLTVYLNLCTMPDGSDGATGAVVVQEPDDPTSIVSQTTTCSYDVDTGAYSFYFNRVCVVEVSPGYTVTVNLTIDTVTMP